jgi:protein gp37
MAATRLKHHPRYKGLAVFENGKARWTGEVRLNYDVLEQPLRWRKPRRVFVASMGDWLHPSIYESFIYRVLDVTQRTPQHIYQFLTKRADRLPVIVKDWMLDRGLYKPPQNIQQGVSIEDQAAADERIPLLLQTPAAVRFVSVEPYLSAVNFTNVRVSSMEVLNALTGISTVPHSESPRYHSLDWVIAGSESGPGARPMDEDWVRDLRDQCQTAGVSFFYKQKLVNGRKVSTPMLDGRTWRQFPVTDGATIDKRRDE